MTNYCPVCGAPISDPQCRFCFSCGEPLLPQNTGGQDPEAASAPFPPNGGYPQPGAPEAQGTPQPPENNRVKTVLICVISVLILALAVAGFFGVKALIDNGGSGGNDSEEEDDDDDGDETKRSKSSRKEEDVGEPTATVPAQDDDLTSIPSTTVPSTTVPPTTVPPTTAPPATAPPTTAPPTPVPPTTVPPVTSQPETTPTSTITPVSGESYMVSFNTPAHAGVNLRSGPGTSYDKLGTVAEGTVFIFTGRTENGYGSVEFYADGVLYSGWIMTAYFGEDHSGGDIYNGSEAIK